MKKNQWTDNDEPPDMTPYADQAYQLIAVLGVALLFSSQEFLNIGVKVSQVDREPVLVIVTSNDLVLKGAKGEKRFRRDQIDSLVHSLPKIDDQQQPPRVGICAEKTDILFDLGRRLQEAGYRVMAARFPKSI